MTGSGGRGATPTPPAASEAGGISATRRAFLPSPTIPLVYFAGAHACLASALAVLVADPALPGAFVYHPRALAVVHLVTLGWISGSILGALYIVAPLAFGVPMRAGRLDAWACASFWAGTSGMVAGFWTGRYDVLGAASLFVLAPMIAVGTRVTIGLGRSRVPAGISLHVVLAFANVAAAGVAGVLLAFNRLTGTFPWSPVSLAAAHAHLALLGWAAMMIIGVAYRLIPMFVPAVMPSGRGLAASAVLLEIGTVGVVVSLAVGRSPGPWLVFVVAALIAFFQVVRTIVRNKRPRPPDLPRRDWSTWHTHLAMAYLFVATVLGIVIAVTGSSPELLWSYGATGLLGFVVQMVVGIGGRLLPMYAWYRAVERRDGVPPAVSAHRLIVPQLSLAVLLCWLAGLPVFTVGLMNGALALIAGGAAAMLAGTMLNAVHIGALARRAAGPALADARLTAPSPRQAGRARP
jgi:hypothetical protein